MTETDNKLRRLLGLVVKAFIMVSVVAVILPVPRYARSLSDEEYIVWFARLIWVLMLTVGVGAVLLIVGYIKEKSAKQNERNRVMQPFTRPALLGGFNKLFNAFNT